MTALLTAIKPRRRARRPAEANGRTVLVPRDALDALAPHAAARGLHVNELVRRLIDHIGDDAGLVTAILEDGDQA